MAFGKKFIQKFGTDKTVEVSIANIEDAIVAFLYSIKAIPEAKDVLQINWEDLCNKKPTDVIKVGVKIRKEINTKSGTGKQKLRKGNGV